MHDAANWTLNNDTPYMRALPAPLPQGTFVPVTDRRKRREARKVAKRAGVAPIGPMQLMLSAPRPVLLIPAWTPSTLAMRERFEKQQYTLPPKSRYEAAALAVEAASMAVEKARKVQLRREAGAVLAKAAKRKVIAMSIRSEGI